MTDPQYWQNRWKNEETGWHQTEVEPALIEYFSNLAPGRVLVPLCGKSLDLAWLASKGHEVIGVELSALACEAFFEEQGLAFEKPGIGAFQIYRSKKIAIFQGDFFELTADLVAGVFGPISAVYDRAALIALPRETREKYAKHLQAIVQPREFLQIAIEWPQGVDSGPPFSVSQAEIELLYGTRYRIERLSLEEGIPLGSHGSARVAESVYRLQPKS